jgi:hypothetical protein
MINPKNTNTTIRFASEMAFATMVAVFLAALAISAVLETGMTNVSYAQISQGQNPICDPSDTHVNGIESRTCGIPKTPSLSSSSSSGTICDPSDTHVNGIESRTCGIPKTSSLSSSVGANSPTTTTTTGPSTPLSASSSSAPATTPSENTTTQGIIPGLLP